MHPFHVSYGFFILLSSLLLLWLQLPWLCWLFQQSVETSVETIFSFNRMLKLPARIMSRRASDVFCAHVRLFGDGFCTFRHACQRIKIKLVTMHDQTPEPPGKLPEESNGDWKQMATTSFFRLNFWSSKSSCFLDHPDNEQNRLRPDENRFHSFYSI